MRNSTKLAIAGIGVVAVLGGGSAIAAATAASARVPVTSASDARPVTFTATDEPAPDTATGGITREQAIEIAKKRVPGAQVTDVEREWEHGQRVWEIELHKGAWEYDVFVSAGSGEIVKYEEDHDDDYDDRDDRDDRHDDDWDDDWDDDYDD